MPRSCTTSLSAKPIWAVVALALVLAPLRGPAGGYTPDSPKVRAMVDRTMAYFDKSKFGNVTLGQVGGPALIGMAVYKHHKRYHRMDRSIPPLTQEALNVVIQVARSPDRLKGQNNYSLGLGLVFLTEVKPASHMSEIGQFVAETERHQQTRGAWGYPSSPTGDTSQTQYPILGLWSAKHVNLDIPQSIIENAANWLIRTQDPSGAWGYQGTDPGTYTRVPQVGIRYSLAAAGLGSLYVAADFLGIRDKNRNKKKRLGGLPPALIPVKEIEAAKKSRRVPSSVDVSRLRQALNDGDGWFAQNFSIATTDYPYYYLYALERFRSFQEMVEGNGDPEPDWYNQGVDLLATMQSSTGDFPAPRNSDVHCPLGIGTAFACLFLLRSTQATLETIMEREGTLRGGRGLPGDLSEVRQRGGKIVAPAITGKVEDLIGMLEDDEADQIENMLDNPDALSLSGLTKTGKQYTARLRRVLRSGSYKARIVAARTLGRQDDLDNVPILIYALTDPDPRVMRAARAALRSISRKFDGYDLPDQPTKPQLDLAVKQWQDWYRSIRPDAMFVEERGK